MVLCSVCEQLSFIHHLHCTGGGGGAQAGAGGGPHGGGPIGIVMVCMGSSWHEHGGMEQEHGDLFDPSAKKKILLVKIFHDSIRIE